MIIHDEATYRAHPALNYSSAKSLLKSPKHFQAALNRKFEPSRDVMRHSRSWRNVAPSWLPTWQMVASTSRSVSYARHLLLP